ncbi:uncharacterized protein N7483_009160 [Penicillium malachiteum]|uniref:uncharacterized protein n=1 Tax=Penicillium malachiteum TaxID=1324776 RepID=UPI0025487D85|nr:uncharacterized protein N7483_009160 [Penicillium malachiteum]KAJ5721226.1 hypothetical protein N7483_009160 [Penicillium malachiteum]
MPRLSILCFGNSLTAGYFHFGLEFHPYDGKFKEVLTEKFPDLKVFTTVEGLPGDLVVFPGSFLGRMKDKCSKVNDLGYRRDVDEIYTGLQEAWNIALESGAKVLALTIPECQTRSEKLDSTRSELNAAIMAHQQKGFYAFDLCRAIPNHDASVEFREQMFDDGLHLTEEGYDLMGTVIAEHFAPLYAAKDPADDSV